MKALDRRSYARRTAALRSLLGTCDAALITNIVNVRYLTGFTGSTGIFASTPNGDHLIVDFRYVEQAKKETPCEVTRRDGPIEKSVKAWLRGGRRCCIESTHVSLDLWNRLQPLAASGEVSWFAEKGLVEKIRIRKDEREVAKLREAARLLSSLMTMTMRKVKPGVREMDVALSFERAARAATGRPLPFEPIVASGPRSALPHGTASMRTIGANEFVVLDLGVNLDGYVADMTRTVCTGKPSAKMRRIHEAVHLANATARKCLKPGMTGAEAHAVAVGVLEAKGLAKYFGHGLGHGLGVEVHEQPWVSGEAAGRLESGMVFTVEPGVYIPGFGGVRIEDSGVITKTGFETFPAPERSLDARPSRRAVKKAARAR